MRPPVSAAPFLQHFRVHFHRIAAPSEREPTSGNASVPVACSKTQRGRAMAGCILLSLTGSWKGHHFTSKGAVGNHSATASWFFFSFCPECVSAVTGFVCRNKHAILTSPVKSAWRRPLWQTAHKAEGMTSNFSSVHYRMPSENSIQKRQNHGDSAVNQYVQLRPTLISILLENT